MNKLSKQQKEILKVLFSIQSHVIKINALRIYMWLFKSGIQKEPNFNFYSIDKKELNITPSFRASFSTSLRRLEYRKLIIRDKAGNNNQTKYISLTPKGWDICHSLFF